jgi:hypothetical protein
MGAGGNGMNFYNTAMYLGEVLQMSDAAIDKFNSVGGLRINGSGDTDISHLPQVRDFFKHAGMRGLKLKWISKQESSFEIISKLQKDKDKDVKRVAKGIAIQPTVDPYWIPVSEDDIKGSAVQELELKKAADAGKLDAVVAAYKDVTGREAKIFDGQVYRKYGFSFDQLKAMKKKYPGVKVTPRLVVGTFQEIAEYALSAPQMIQTWMHAAIRPGMYSEVNGKVLSQGEVGNFTQRAKLVKEGDRWRVVATTKEGKVIKGAKTYDALTNYIYDNYTDKQATKIFDTLFGMIKKDSSALCCRAGASLDACFDCTSHCSQGTSYTGTQIMKMADVAADKGVFANTEISEELIMDSIPEDFDKRMYKAGVRVDSTLGVGKDIGGSTYLFRQYEDLIPNIEKYRKALPEDFDYQYVKWNRAKDQMTFSESPNWANADEPIVGNQILVREDGTTKFMKQQKDPWIIHHKWTMVDSDYKGFDIDQAKIRSAQWTSLKGTETSKIGKWSYWEQNILPQLGPTGAKATDISFDIDEDFFLQGITEAELKEKGWEPWMQMHTQIPGTKPSYVKFKGLLDTMGIKGKKILDFAAGLGHGAKTMKSKSFEPFPQKGFKPDWTDAGMITETFDAVTNNATLNVLPADKRAEVIKQIGSLLSDQGIAIIQARGRDFLKTIKDPDFINKETGEILTHSRMIDGKEVRTYQKGYKNDAELGQEIISVLGPGFAYENAGAMLKLSSPAVIVRRTGHMGDMDLDLDFESDMTPEMEALLKEKFGKKKRSLGTIVRESTEDFWQHKTTRTVDRLHPIKQFFGEGMSYMMHRGIPGVQSTLNALFGHGKLQWDPSKALTVKTRKEGFLPWIKSLGPDSNKFFYWVMAKRAETLEAEGRENWLTKDVRKIIFDWVGKPQGDKTWDQINTEFQEWNQNVLDIAVDAGLLSKSQIEEWQRDFYIPFYRVFEDADAKAEYVKGPAKGKINLSARVMRLKGADQKLGDPFENILKNWSHLVGESMANMARAEAFNYGIDNNIPSGMTKIDDDGNEVTVPMIDEVSAADTMIFKSGGKDKNMIFVSKKTQDEVLSFKRDGKSVYFRVNDPELFQALSLVNKKYLDGHVMRAMSGAKRVLTAGATFGPAFRVANMIRDTLHTYQITDKWTFKPVLDTMKGFMSAIRNDQHMVEFMASGHAFGGSYVKAEDPKAVQRYVKKMSKEKGRYAKNVGETILDTPRKLLEFWEKIGSASENAARVQLYKNLKQEGKTHMEAAFSARDLMDFQMKGNGDVVGFLVATVPFLNARMQGLYRMGRSAVENPKVFFAKGAMIAMASLALWWINHDDERYKELESWEKFSYYHFWIGDTHFRIPKPFETGVFFSTMWESAADVAVGNEDSEHLLKTITHAAGETFAFNPIPQMVRPLAEQWANKSFFSGRPIESMYQQKLVRGQRFDPWTSETLQLAGRLGIPPKRAEALIRGYFADIGMGILGVTDMMVKALVDFPVEPTKRVDQYPMVGRFVRQGKSPRSTKYMSKFWDAMTEADELTTTLNMYKQSGSHDEARALVAKNRKILGQKPRLNKARQAIRKMSFQIKQIWKNDRYTAEQKKAEIDKIIERRNELVKHIYDNYLKEK